MTMLTIPRGRAAVSEDAAARKRREVREKLLRGEVVKVSQSGTIRGQNDPAPNTEPAIEVPEGKLAAGFHWYDNDPGLLVEEKGAMRCFFPQFQLDKLDDGRLCWTGALQTDLRPDGIWYIQAVYENNHPDNSTYGGSVKVYSIEPDLEELRSQLGGIPHVLKDSSGKIYLCTAEAHDVHAGPTRSTSAASSIAWAVKWISAFELWLANDMTTAEFSSHF